MCCIYKNFSYVSLYTYANMRLPWNCVYTLCITKQPNKYIPKRPLKSPCFGDRGFFFVYTYICSMARSLHIICYKRDYLQQLKWIYSERYIVMWAFFLSIDILVLEIWGWESRYWKYERSARYLISIMDFSKKYYKIYSYIFTHAYICINTCIK